MPKSILTNKNTLEHQGTHGCFLNIDITVVDGSFIFKLSGKGFLSIFNHEGDPYR